MTWAEIDHKLAQGASLPQAQELLALSRLRIPQAPRDLRRARPHRRCPLPPMTAQRPPEPDRLRLFLFIRDIADGDLVGWIDRRLQAGSSPADPDRLTRMRGRLVGPLRNSMASPTRCSR